MPADVKINAPIRFLNCTVTNFTCSLGLNSNPSVMDIQLVEDVQDDFEADSYDPTQTTEADRIKSIKGGSAFLDGNPGHYDYFQNGNFKFGGIVTSWKRNHSSSGRFINIQLADPRMFFKDIPVITDHCPTLFGSTDPFNNYNVSTPLLDFSNPIAARWTLDGLPWSSLQTHFSLLTFKFYGKNYKVSFDSSFSSRIPFNYRVPLQNASLDEFINRVSRDNNMDWFAACNDDAATNPKTIMVYGVRRDNQYSLNDTTMTNFIADLSSKISNYEIGRELRTDPVKGIFIGDHKRTLQEVTSLTPVFYVGADGYLSDQAFIDLSCIHSDNSTLLSNLPSVTFPQLKSLRTDGSVSTTQVSDSTTTKSRSTSTRKGYFVNEYILRAALHGKESWATAVWYGFKEIYSSFQYKLFSGFDEGNNIFNSSGNTTVTINQPALAAIPRKMGIFAPPFNRENPSFCDVPTTINTSIGTPSPESEAIKEACYQATLKVAQEYYGRVFIGYMHDSTTITAIKAAGGQYTYLHKKIPVEFEICDAAPAVSDPNNDGSFINLPYIFKNSESGAFRSNEGMYRPYLTIDYDFIRSNFASPRLDNFDPASYLKINKADQSSTSQATDSNCYIARADINIEQNKFDPRYVVLTLNEPIYVGLGSRRYGTVTTYTGTDSEVQTDPRYLGRTKTATFSDQYAVNPLTKKDKSGGTQEFLSWLYSDYTIFTEPLNDNNSNTWVDINGNTKEITGKKYLELQNGFAKAFQEKIGFAERRYVGIEKSGGGVALTGLALVVPLKWNFLRYGPFFGTSTDINLNYRPTQILEDTNLNPWNYGSAANMVAAGNIMADNSSGSASTVGYASITVADLPNYSIGYALKTGSGNTEAIISNLADISLSYGMSGFTTTYRFKTFFGPTGFRKKQDVDSSLYNAQRIAEAKKEFIKIDALVKDFQPEAGRRFIYNDRSKSVLSSNITSGQDKNTSVDGSYLMSSAVVGNDGRPLVSLISAGTIKETTNSDVNMHQQYAYAGLSELFTPITSQYPESNQQTPFILPSIHGIPIGGTVAFNVKALPPSVVASKKDDPIEPYIDAFEVFSIEEL